MSVVGYRGDEEGEVGGRDIERRLLGDVGERSSDGGELDRKGGCGSLVGRYSNTRGRAVRG